VVTDPLTKISPYLKYSRDIQNLYKKHKQDQMSGQLSYLKLPQINGAKVDTNLYGYLPKIDSLQKLLPNLSMANNSSIAVKPTQILAN